MKSIPQEPELSLTKKIGFSLVPFAVICLVLVGIEIGFRIFWTSKSAQLIETATYDGRPWLRINRSYLANYFPASSPLIPELKPSLISIDRPPGSLRILCLGGSSMFGTPYEVAATIPAIVRKQLRHLYQNREIEVLNLGASAINTNVIRDMAPDLVELKPDLVFLYAGHNEFYGPDGIGASWLEKTFPWIIRVKYTLRRLRTIQWVQEMLRTHWLAHHETDEQNLMRQVSEESHVSSGSDDEQWIFRQFRINLADIIELYRSHGAAVIVSDVSSNLMFPPFAGQNVEGLHQIDSLIGRNESARAADQLSALRRTHLANAYIEYRLGLCTLSSRDSVGARSYFENARDDDLLKFRAPGGINTIIHAVCTDLNVPCVHADSGLSAASPYGITGSSLFWEHLHPRMEGYCDIAGMLVEAFLRTQHADSSPPGKPLLPCNADSLSIPWLDLAYGDLSIKGLTTRWPFEHYVVSLSVYPSADPALQQIARSVYTKQIGWNEGCLQTARFFAAHGEVRQAATTYEALLEDYPRAYLTRYLLAVLLRDAGRPTEAIPQYERCIRDNPAYPFARVDLGLLLVNEGMLDSARLHLRTALELGERQHAPLTLLASAHYGLAAIAANTGAFGDALREVEQALREAPTYGAARELRNQLVARSPKP
jgi:tetratricopeptide (TPR) repeat protein